MKGNEIEGGDSQACLKHMMHTDDDVGAVEYKFGVATDLEEELIEDFGYYRCQTCRHKIASVLSIRVLQLSSRNSIVSVIGIVGL